MLDKNVSKQLFLGCRSEVFFPGSIFDFHREFDVVNKA